MERRAMGWCLFGAHIVLYAAIHPLMILIPVVDMLILHHTERIPKSCLEIMCQQEIIKLDIAYSVNHWKPH